MDVSTPRARLHLYRYAETAWAGVLRPWLLQAHGRLVRSTVVVPTRGQAYALKQRCVIDRLALLGVEFLTPGLARKKWLPLQAESDPALARPAAGREILLLGLRILVAERLRALSSDHPDWGFWKSVESDLERVLEEFDALLKAGFRESDFSLPLLRALFAELRMWVHGLGYDFASLQSERAALTRADAAARRLPGRLVIYGFSVELWPEFFNVAALARCFDEIDVVLPEPEWRGQRQLDEKWIELWEAFLGVQGEPIDAPPPPSCEAVLGLVGNTRGGAFPSGEEPPCRVVVGRTRADEMELVAVEIAQALNRGARHVGVVFPAADAAYARLQTILRERCIQFHTTIDAPAPVDLETRLQRALIQFYQSGARLEDLLEVWPLLKQLGQTQLPLGDARDVGQRWFDERQTHALSTYERDFDAAASAAAREVVRIARILLPDFAAESTIAHVVERISQVYAAFDLLVPPSVEMLRSFGEKENRALPSAALLATARSLIPDALRAEQAGESSFARVTLFTRRRAEGASFSHLILAESNAGVWPQRREASPWLPDEHRTELDRTARFSLGLMRAEDRAWCERQSYAALIRDTAVEVIFSAAEFDEAEPETRLTPNSWVERVLWANPEIRAAECGLDELLGTLAIAAPRTARDEALVEQGAWLDVWRSRRDPARAFDEYFFTVDAKEIRPDVLTARLIESAIKDPAELWFEAILQAHPVDWRPFVRARKRALGQWAHRVLATALQPGERNGELGGRRPAEQSRARLQTELERLAALWPRNRYWESFQLELARACERLLADVEALPGGAWVATELPLPREATIPIGHGERLRVRGRVDLAYFDRPEWAGARVEIVDFKTGADTALSAARMASEGFALQLGVYLAAAQSLGVSDGRVWMLKPELNGFSQLSLAQLPAALVALEQLGGHLRTGVYGALTPDLSDYAPESRVWPLACVPIAEEILEQKFAQSFAFVGGGDA